MLNILDLNIRKAGFKKNTPEYLECLKSIEAIEAELKNAEELKKELINTIDRMPNGEIKYIVQMYFISGEKIENIARKINRTRRHIYDVIGQLKQSLGGNNSNVR